MSQLALFIQEQAHWEAIAERFMELLTAIVDRRGLKEVAYALSTEDEPVSPARLAHALAGRNRHVPSARWVPRIIAMAEDDEAVEFLAMLRGKELRPAKPLSPEEEVAAWRSAVAELPPDLRQCMQARVAAWKSKGRG